jgi:type I restriction enzyme M protein
MQLIHSAILGAIIGDIAGSKFEGHAKSTIPSDYDFFDDESVPTDDSIMTLAVLKAVQEKKGKLSDLTTKYMRAYGAKYPSFGYGPSFFEWIFEDDPKPYNSCGNGAAMRISSVGELKKGRHCIVKASKDVTGVTHNHPEGLKGAECVASVIDLCKPDTLSFNLFYPKGHNRLTVMKWVEMNYYSIPDYNTLLESNNSYGCGILCDQVIPQTLSAFFSSNTYEEAVRKVIALGGDTDTAGAICGAMAGMFFGIPEDMVHQAVAKFSFDPELVAQLDDYLSHMYQCRIEDTHDESNV